MYFGGAMLFYLGEKKFYINILADINEYLYYTLYFTVYP